jgi:hypothetical protein
VERKDEAYIFLRGLEFFLNKTLPEPAAMRAHMRHLAASEGNPSKIRENLFLYDVLPHVSSYIQETAGISPAEVRKTILCEYHAKVPKLSSGNSFRKVGHPFSKNRSLPSDAIVDKWLKPGPLPINQAYPDFALCPPFPYKIVFDAKYFDGPGAAAAKKQLVEGAYEVMFYRGLPSTKPRKQSEVGWDYEFGCLLAFDASENGELVALWDAVKTKEAFWEGANTFIMIVRGTNSASVGA